jgi:hypothetical protein
MNFSRLRDMLEPPSPATVPLNFSIEVSYQFVGFEIVCEGGTFWPGQRTEYVIVDLRKPGLGFLCGLPTLLTDQILGDILATAGVELVGADFGERGVCIEDSVGPMSTIRGFFKSFVLFLASVHIR